MKLPRPRSSRRGDEHLIPLINVIFLLLIFFLIAGSFAPPEPFTVVPPVSVEAPRTGVDRPVLTLDAEGQLALDGERLVPDALAAVVGMLVTADPVAPPLVLKADSAVPVARLRETLAALRAAGVAQVTLLTVPVR